MKKMMTLAAMALFLLATATTSFAGYHAPVNCEDSKVKLNALIESNASKQAIAVAQKNVEASCNR